MRSHNANRDVPNNGSQRSSAQRSSAQRASGNSATPPSFSPRSSSSRNGSGRTATPRPLDGTPQSFTPRQSASSRSSRSSQGRTANSSTSRVPSSSRGNEYARSTPASSNSSRPASFSSSRGGASSVAPMRNGAAVRKGRAGRIIASVLAIILAIALIFGVWGWFWVDSQLNRTIDLTNASDNSAAHRWLILGSDSREGQTVGSGDAGQLTGFRTDTILVLTKPQSGPASLISIPRDSYVEVNGEGMKINSVAQFAGYDALISSVESITGSKIDHIAQIGFDGVANIVDALDGVELCYDNDVNDPYSTLNWTAGCHVADGPTALAFARMRYADPEGDIGRAKRQRQVISAIMHKAASSSTLTNPSKAIRVASATFKALSVDKSANTGSMISMALAFRDASGSHGVTGSVYFDNLDYEPGGIGSAVHLDAEKNTELFNSLNAGTISEGTSVGGYTGQ
ncbi:LytR family transcriptional regulator [Alloscardovia theropitheci]|uniref:LytR family transcriptional regulator n=2 Tax=Alloscardovia theropitheci TaxID=2496842 RepID=A0A4R0QY27_9BIFI|nr:LytR family transcriptional regulator [Alloscardovia theropitheci]